MKKQSSVKKVCSGQVHHNQPQRQGRRGSTSKARSDMVTHLLPKCLKRNSCSSTEKKTRTASLMEESANAATVGAPSAMKNSSYIKGINKKLKIQLRSPDALADQSKTRITTHNHRKDGVPWRAQ